jgi:hypothetical protein
MSIEQFLIFASRLFIHCSHAVLYETCEQRACSVTISLLCRINAATRLLICTLLDVSLI